MIAAYGQWNAVASPAFMDDRIWPRKAPPNWPAPTSHYIEREWWGDLEGAQSSNSQLVFPASGVADQIDNYRMNRSFVGWPIRSMWCWELFENHGTRTTTGVLPSGAPSAASTAFLCSACWVRLCSARSPWGSR